MKKKNYVEYNICPTKKLNKELVGQYVISRKDTLVAVFSELCFVVFAR